MCHFKMNNTFYLELPWFFCLHFKFKLIGWIVCATNYREKKTHKKLANSTNCFQKWSERKKIIPEIFSSSKNEMISTIGVITGAKTGMSKETKNNLSMSYRFSNLESLFYTQVMEWFMLYKVSMYYMILCQQVCFFLCAAISLRSTHVVSYYMLVTLTWVT